MFSVKAKEFILQGLKGLQSAYYSGDYQKLRRQLDSLEEAGYDSYRKQLLSKLPAPETVRSILIFKPDDIGDAIHALPAIAEVKRHYPGSRLYLVCQRITEPIFERVGLIDEIASVDVEKIFLRFPQLSIRDALRQLSTQTFDVAIFLRTYPAFFRQFKKLAARYLVHPLDPRLPSDSELKAPVSLWGSDRAHQAHQLFQVAALLTGNYEGLTHLAYPAFQWTAQDREAVEIVFGKNPAKKFLVVHPYARFETRQYPLDYWKEILVWLQTRLAIPIVVIGGVEDDPLPVPGLVQMQGKLTLAQSGYLISRSSLFLGNESGPGHWAGALGIPTVVFFGGHSSANEWAPRGKVLLIHQKVECSPCHRRVCPGYGVKCLGQLVPRGVIPQLESFLSGIL